MKDHAYPIRQNLIAKVSKHSSAKLHYRELIARGLREEDATNMSGYHPMDDLHRLWPDLLIYALFAVGALLLVQLAAMADELPGAKASEAALVACVNGQPILLGERAYYCVDMGEK